MNFIDERGGEADSLVFSEPVKPTPHGRRLERGRGRRDENEGEDVGPAAPRVAHLEQVPAAFELERL